MKVTVPQGELDAVWDQYREHTWYRTNFDAWRRNTLEPIWRRDAETRHDGWSSDLADRADAWACGREDEDWAAQQEAEYLEYMQAEYQQQADSVELENLWRHWRSW